MKLVVTGAGGALGREVVREALRRGIEVIGLESAENAALPAHPRLAVHICDVTNYESLLAHLEGADAVLHLAVNPAMSAHDVVVHNGNVTGSYNVLRAAAERGITRVSLASSCNVYGLTFSLRPSFLYFPVDEAHPCLAEDAYGLSKLTLEVQAQAMARRHPEMTVSALRFHMLVQEREEARRSYKRLARGARSLFGFTTFGMAMEACLRSLELRHSGYQPFNIVAPVSAMNRTSRELTDRFYPGIEIRGEFEGTASFFDSSKARRLLGC
ncbi:MAG: NAD(P)-dependent oxidoreductase [Aestuariivirga sp.]|nr:NAD(P)-dependent oxidoreductase [Aestuariivirga sp.]